MASYTKCAGQRLNDTLCPVETRHCLPPLHLGDCGAVLCCYSPVHATDPKFGYVGRTRRIMPRSLLPAMSDESRMPVRQEFQVAV